MADIKVRDLTDTSSVALDNQIMVLTNDEQNQVQNITVEKLLSNVLSSDNGNVLEQRTDGKLYVETPENITGDLADLDTVNKTSLVNSINEVVSNLSTEATTRANADNNLQSQIDAITAASDVTDIVGTYAQLQAYDTTGLPDNSIIKVLQDESRQNETTYYRWVITGGVGAWVLIGEEGPYYTKSQADSLFATQQTTGNLASLDTSDKTSLVNAINELSSVLDPTQTADYINNSKAVESGAISSNSIILSNVIKYAHSSFDLSKFTVVGSPTITDDGIASGFSGSNYLTVSTATHNIDFTKPFKLHIDGTYKDVTENTYGVIFMPNVSGWALDLRIKLTPTTAQAVFHLAVGSSETIVNNMTVTLNNNKFNLVLDWTGSQYKLSSYDTTGIIIGNQATYSSNSAIYQAANITAIHIGSRYGNNYSAFVSGSIDLKQFSITVDGVEVFSGNKTGIDTIKPDDYTVVGSPTISADGIYLQGYGNTTGSNKVDCDNNTFAINSSNQSFESIFYIEPVPSDYEYPNQIEEIITLRNATTSPSRIRIIRTQLTTNNALYIEQHVNGTWVGNSDATNWKLGADFRGWVKAVIYFDEEASCYKCDFYTYNNGVATFVKTTVCNYTGEPVTGANCHVFFSYGQYENYGKMDLNSVKAYDNGNLVYQPCLKIPYTKGSEQYGGKYVNAQYLPRVKDAYEQGLANDYFTLDEVNGTYTLPMGNLYGMIEKLNQLANDEIGLPKATLSNTLNDNEIWLEGAEVSKLTYSKLYAIYGDDYGTPTDSANFVLPDFRDRVMQGIGSGGTFGYISAGLPNITGNTGYGGNETGTMSGAFYSGGGSTVWGPNSYGYENHTAYFNASRSSSIYGNSTTVQPPAIKVRFKTRFQ